MSTTVSQEPEQITTQENANPFLDHAYPSEPLLFAVNGLLREIDRDMYGPTCRIGDHESVFLTSVRQAAARENYFRALIDEASRAQSRRCSAEEAASV